MPRIRQWKVPIMIRVNEDVTPDYLAMRVAQTTGSLRPGESVGAIGSKKRYVIEDRSMLDAMGGWPPKQN